MVLIKRLKSAMAIARFHLCQCSRVSIVESAQASDKFLWDLRRTVADMIAENYLADFDAAHKHGLLWCEPYGHAGFPGDFTVYGGQADQVSGEF